MKTVMKGQIESSRINSRQIREDEITKFVKKILKRTKKKRKFFP